MATFCYFSMHRKEWQVVDILWSPGSYNKYCWAPCKAASTILHKQQHCGQKSYTEYRLPHFSEFHTLVWSTWRPHYSHPGSAYNVSTVRFLTPCLSFWLLPLPLHGWILYSLTETLPADSNLPTISTPSLRLGAKFHHSFPCWIHAASGFWVCQVLCKMVRSCGVKVCWRACKFSYQCRVSEVERGQNEFMA